MNIVRHVTAASMLSLVCSSPLLGQGPSQEPANSEVPWETGPAVGSLGSQSKVRIGDGCLFTGRDGTRAFLTLTHNPTNGSERGTVLCTILRARADTNQWFAVFEYDGSGYVKDDEKGSLDADAILSSLREGTEASNKMRRERGWTALHVQGWERPPFYDPETNNLTWAVRVKDEDGSESINHSVRLLGREGVMKVDLVVDPQDYRTSLPAFAQLIAGHEYSGGYRYSEWREGDKVASYGLTALVAGGAGAIAAKTGLLGKLWKLIVGIGVAALAGVRRLFSGRSGEEGE